MPHPTLLPLAETARLLVEGGDERIALDPVSGVNRYGCRATPYPELLSFASATASVISASAYAAADDARTRLQDLLEHQTPEIVYATELQRLRGDLLTLCELQELPEPAVIFAASGTDLHHIAAQIALASSDHELLVIMVNEEETGSGVYATITHADPAIAITTVNLRHDDGTARSQTEIDADFSGLAHKAHQLGRHVLLIQTDLSKTGVIAPSYACTAELRAALGNELDVLIDACQFRVSPSTLRACLSQGYSVALTGSKFLGGPSFSGALLIPKQSAARIPSSNEHATPAQNATSDIWQARYTDSDSWGMLLRWEAALCELRAFRAVPEAQVSRFMYRFADSMRTRLDNDPAFSPVTVAPLTRNALYDDSGWDTIQSIFTFRLHRSDSSGRKTLDAAQVRDVYRQLPFAPMPCQLAQPVHSGVARDALRLCLSAHLVVHACADESDAQRIIAQANTVLDQVAALAHRGPPELPQHESRTPLSSVDVVSHLDVHQRITMG